MPLLYKNICPKCGNKENSRMPREGHMRLVPGSKYYQCLKCGNEFLINSLLVAPFVLIFYLLKFLLWVLWDFSTIRYFFQTICPPTGPLGSKRAPSTFLIWVIGALSLYIILYGIAQQGYNSRICLIENKANTILSQLSIPNEQLRKKAIDMIPKVQNMLYHEKPYLHDPISVLRYFFSKPKQPNDAINGMLKTAIETFKDQLDSVILSKADLRDANFHGANLRRADLSNSNLSGADLREAELNAAILDGANLQGADLRMSRSLAIDQLSKTKTLYQAKLNSDIRKEIRKNFAHLFNPPNKR